MGVVIVDVTTPTPYGYFFRKYVPLPHHIATLVELGRFWTHYRIVKLDETVQLSTKSKGQQDNLHPQAERLDQV